MENKELIELAIEARDKASYTPYSNYKVGAAVEMEDGSVYSAGNIEIASYSPTICAERTAIFKGVSEGHRKIKKIAVISCDGEAFPCGVCRQVIREFGKDAQIIVAHSAEEYKIFTLDDLLPHSFGPDNLGVK